ncbi:MAG: WD40 repeat domain-containing protein [Fuerstiella sp.]
MTPQEEWKTKTLQYVSDINGFVERGIRDGWDDVGVQPKDPGLEHLADAAMAAVRRANKNGTFDELRSDWPVAHAPLIHLLENKAHSIPVLMLQDDGSIVARIGTEYQDGKVVHIKGDEVHDVDGIESFGQCPNRRYVAIATENGVQITDGWQGPEVCMCQWPTGLEDLPEGATAEALEAPPRPTQLIPFPNGQRVLLVSDAGIFVLSRGVARRLLPTVADLQEYIDEEPDEPLSFYLSMQHGAVSPNGKWIAVGHQDSTHPIFNEDLEQIADIGNESSYPHFALFSRKSDTVVLNSCHFYNGVTLATPTSLFPGLKTGAYKNDERTPVVQSGARVYAGVHRDGEFIVGDADGYLRAFTKTGEETWQHFIGSTIGDIDISKDGKTLVVSTYAGFISIIKLDAGERPEFQIGTGQHAEQRRWLFWKNEDRPLIW